MKLLPDEIKKILPNIGSTDNENDPMGLKIERDLYFEPKPISQCN